MEQFTSGKSDGRQQWCHPSPSSSLHPPAHFLHLMHQLLFARSITRFHVSFGALLFASIAIARYLKVNEWGLGVFLQRHQLDLAIDLPEPWDEWNVDIDFTQEE
jgi:hypothetical protein